jgi:hypothetical protein
MLRFKEILVQEGIGTKIKKGLINLLWEEKFPHLREIATPCDFSNTILKVEVRDSTSLHYLWFQKEELRKVLNTALKEELIKEIKFEKREIRR